MKLENAMKVEAIDELAFYQIDAPRRAIEHDCAHRFAQLDLGEPLGRFGLSWRSPLIEPIVRLALDRQVVWIGIDQQLAAIDLKSGRVLVSLSFSAYLVQILALSGVTAVLTETEVLLFNASGSIRMRRGLPDLATGMVVAGGELEIDCLEGDGVNLDLQTGVLKEKCLL